ncbi:BMP family lipoprotein [Microbacterium sp. SA39]|uniref:BMP family lipoprotein n=1 Tax=Microbacterium sp. SA39 TaxID=1263625 RepID=UPI0005FA0416|nr:BMP family ABC transporter substrate-binding protein [Microbacterium sp. SA39]KJQ53887.1 Membrane lipoprotein TmpC precursor [Microbacterium sp. SA39]
MRTRSLSVAFGATSVAALVLTGCSGTSSDSGSGSTGSESVAMMVPGTAGDGGFFDQAITGVEAGAEQAGWTTQIVEAGYEPTRWQPALDDLANGESATIITSTFAMVDLLTQAATRFPDKQFAIFDAVVDAPNVYSITYRYDETGFLAGVLAGLLETSSGVDRVTGTGVVGVVGGQDIPTINDYIDGFEAGVASVAPDVKVLKAYAGSFADPVKGKAIAADMIGQGAEIVFTASGGTDTGVFEAAADGEVWAIGNAEVQTTSPEINGTPVVLTAATTSTRESVQDAVAQAGAGTLPVGETRSFGVADGSIWIVESDLYTETVPQEIRDQVDAITEAVAAGEYESLLTGE